MQANMVTPMDARLTTFLDFWDNYSFKSEYPLSNQPIFVKMDYIGDNGQFLAVTVCAQPEGGPLLEFVIPPMLCGNS